MRQGKWATESQGTERPDEWWLPAGEMDPPSPELTSVVKEGYPRRHQSPSNPSNNPKPREGGCPQDPNADESLQVNSERMSHSKILAADDLYKYLSGYSGEKWTSS